MLKEKCRGNDLEISRASSQSQKCSFFEVDLKPHTDVVIPGGRVDSDGPCHNRLVESVLNHSILVCVAIEDSPTVNESPVDAIV
jgi:hypothetical protein